MASNKFSGALQISGLDDFIAPSQECIKPIPAPKAGSDRGKIEMEDGKYFEIDPFTGEREQLEKAKITLADCLACSGCVTSAESVLIQAQSIEEFQANSIEKKGGRIVVVSIAPQVRASLAVHFGLDLVSTTQKLVSYLKKTFQVDYVFDSSFSREFALIELQSEFLERFDQPENLPLLCSACPGWVCYAEKRHGDYILSKISKVKSPQQIMGSLVKKYFADKLKRKPEEIYHTTIMPCFDKKLEASRQDFVDQLSQQHDVDCVLTSLEVVDLMKETGVDFHSLGGLPLDQMFSNVTPDGKFFGNPGGSGGYAEMIYKYVAAKRFGIVVNEVPFKTKRNSDFQVATLEVDGKTVLNVAITNGFRNIQNLLRQCKQGKCPYHYVEVMACPSGCLNGGAQVPREPKKMTGKELIGKVSELYHSQQDVMLGQINPAVLQIYDEWLGGMGTKIGKEILYTEYHNVPQETAEPLAIKW